MITAKIVADSVAEDTGERLTTFELCYPRFIHAQLMTHRLFSRNSASSRAIPTAKLIERIENDPVMPVHWGKNQKGMQAEGEIDQVTRAAAKVEWLRAADDAVRHARELLRLGAHKQIVNRVVEPWMYITTIVSATEYDNWFHLRGGDAQPEIAHLATLMKEARNTSKPETLEDGDWHVPYVAVTDPTSPLHVTELEAADVSDSVNSPVAYHDRATRGLVAISAARCARVSYLTHDGKRSLSADVGLHNRLCKSGHWSPFEHVATPHRGRFGNFFGWKQYRKFFRHEHHGRNLL